MATRCVCRSALIFFPNVEWVGFVKIPELR